MSKIQSIPYQRLTTAQIQSKTDWYPDEIVVNSDINKYVQYQNGKAKIIDGQINEVTVSANYTLNDIENFIIVDNITSDIIISVPNLVADLIGKEWRIIRNDNSSFNVFVSLENPTNSLFNEQFHTLNLREQGEGVVIRGQKNIKYSYSEYSGKYLVASIPIIITSSADLSGTSLLMYGTVQYFGYNLQVDVAFRYREEGTATWTQTAFIAINTAQTFNDIANVTSGVRYEVQAILKDTKGILFYGEIILSASWIDLRTGGEILTAGNSAGNDIRFRSGMAINRDANGMYFTGSNPWQSWVKFEKYKWNRGQNKTIEWVFSRPSSAMMLGIGSDATDETSSSQYSQAENQAYFNNSNNLYGLYGNNGILGNGTSQNMNTDLTGGSGIYKIKFTNDGSGGTGTFSIYELPSSNKADWDNESNLLRTWTIGSNMSADENVLMPFIIPISGGTQRFIAFKIS